MDTGSVVWIVTAGVILFGALFMLWHGRASHGDPDDHARHEHLDPFTRREDFAGGGSRPARVSVRVEAENSTGPRRRG